MSTSPPTTIAPRPIRFFQGGEIRSVQDLAPSTTVLQWLREHAHCTGTKEGCAEGDCGACTVLLGELVDGQLQLRNVNACTQFLPTLDGLALLTVEDLGSSQALNPVQQAMLDCHASQCGFCTPGFVMSLQACYERHCEAGSRPTRQQLADDLAGNLCRCTGYRPILDAGQAMFERPQQRINSAPITAALQQLQQDPPLHYAAANPAFQQRIDHFHAPRSLAALAELRLALPQARLLAGSTDIALWHNKQFRDLGELIYLGAVAALREIRSEPWADSRPGLWIGAGARLEQAWAALSEAAPELRELWLRFASPPVRQAGTLGGNIANGSPIGDGAPALIALGADIVLRQSAAQRRLPLQDFYLDYMKNALRPGEFVEALHLPLPAANQPLRAYKISKRFDSDISALCAVFALQLDADQTVRQARLVFGGMAATVKRAAAAEAALLGQAWSAEAAALAAQALSQDFQPLSDMRASSDYRLRVAQNLMHKLWLETRPEQPLLAQQSRIWQLRSQA
ncbi:xanthine dehydrogenase small subunit [Paucibacter oligotrophus]|uniref:Xanthine dehydrogenase small subunit n=1 Tax=Roseateles oligotrophus TaxID=1769250 RepID=A0A840LI48_9BURK|nr:xanthine dehydrogenase small subunit [Roseateles oligotrophus]MBB4845878.1 xanthine dehydrogenase small subunit [Roseateles oligotrophus]